MTDRKKPGVAFWATVVVVGLPVLYMLGIGVLTLLFHRGIIEQDSAAYNFYWAYAWPARSIYLRSPAAIRHALDFYYGLWRF
jgi:hypothetical protein